MGRVRARKALEKVPRVHGPKHAKPRGKAEDHHEYPLCYKGPVSFSDIACPMRGLRKVFFVMEWELEIQPLRCANKSKGNAHKRPFKYKGEPRAHVANVMCHDGRLAMVSMM